jgi:hypothetical protein
MCKTYIIRWIDNPRNTLTMIRMDIRIAQKFVIGSSSPQRGLSSPAIWADRFFRDGTAHRALWKIGDAYKGRKSGGHWITTLSLLAYLGIIWINRSLWCRRSPVRELGLFLCEFCSCHSRIITDLCFWKETKVGRIGCKVVNPLSCATKLELC